MKLKLLTAHCLLLTLVLLALVALPSFASATSVSAGSRSFPFSSMPEQTTKRQQIVDEIKLRLAQIDSAADPIVLPDGSEFQFQTDIGKNIIDRWATNYAETELKAAESSARISIFDLVRSRQKEYPDQAQLVATLPIQVRVYHADQTPEELTKMLADIQRAVVTNRDTKTQDLQLNDLAVDILPGDDGFQLPKESFELEFAAVGFDIEHMIGPYEQ